jgi:hypothetical protein
VVVATVIDKAIRLADRDTKTRRIRCSPFKSGILPDTINSASQHS